MLVTVACRFVLRRAHASHISRIRPFNNPSVALFSAALMVQTRRAIQLSAKDEARHKSVDVKPPTKGEHTRRPLKRARKEHQPPGERASSVVATEPKEPEGKTQ